MKLTHHRSTVLISAAASLLATGFLHIVPTAKAGQIDPRFDGQWVGVETFLPASGGETWNRQNPQIRTVFSISNCGQTVRVLSGFVPGRYWVEPKSDGKTLMITGSGNRAGRNTCRLELSGDGNTITESAIVGFISRHANVDGFSNRAIAGNTARVYATFKRAGGEPPVQGPKKAHS